MTWRLLLAWALVGSAHLAALAQSAPREVQQVDARAEVAAALYAASATQAAVERAADARLTTLRTRIDRLREEVRSAAAGAARTQAELTVAQESASRTWRLAIARMRKMPSSERRSRILRPRQKARQPWLASTPATSQALWRFWTTSVTRAMRRARSAPTWSAVEGRRIATLALEARGKGKQTTAQVITQSEVTRLESGGRALGLDRNRPALPGRWPVGRRPAGRRGGGEHPDRRSRSRDDV